MSAPEYTRLADDGCPLCPEHVGLARRWVKTVATVTIGELTHIAEWPGLKVAWGEIKYSLERKP